MNETAVAYTCAIALTISSVLAWFATFHDARDLLVVSGAFSGMAILLICFVLVCKYA